MELELNPTLVLQKPWNWDEKTISWAKEKVKSEKYREGQRACLECKSILDNPYIKETSDRKDWSDGFLSYDDA